MRLSLRRASKNGAKSPAKMLAWAFAIGLLFGLIGAATRLLGGGGRVLPLTNRGVITMSIAWMAVNAVLGLIGFAPGAEGSRIAWEAHAFGFLFGILAIGPLARWFAPLPERFDPGKI